MPKTTTKTVTWFEIPARDFDRAVSFYQTLYGTAFEKTIMGEIPMHFSPAVKKVLREIMVRPAPLRNGPGLIRHRREPGWSCICMPATELRK